jgi:hypothetical protein
LYYVGAAIEIGSGDASVAIGLLPWWWSCLTPTTPLACSCASRMFMCLSHVHVPLACPRVTRMSPCHSHAHVHVPLTCACPRVTRMSTCHSHARVHVSLACSRVTQAAKHEYSEQWQRRRSWGKLDTMRGVANLSTERWRYTHSRRVQTHTGGTQTHTHWRYTHASAVHTHQYTHRYT